MGWWSLGLEDADDWIGDPVADRVGRALAEHARACDARGAPRPSLAELLAALAEALHRKADTWCGREDAAHFETLAAKTTRDGQSAVVLAAPSFDHALVERLVDAFDDVAVQYDDAFDRPPRRHELLGVVAFVLGAPTVLSEPDDLSVDEVIAHSSANQSGTPSSQR